MRRRNGTLTSWFTPVSICSISRVMLGSRSTGSMVFTMRSISSPMVLVRFAISVVSTATVCTETLMSLILVYPTIAIPSRQTTATTAVKACTIMILVSIFSYGFNELRSCTRISFSDDRVYDLRITASCSASGFTGVGRWGRAESAEGKGRVRQLEELPLASGQTRRRGWRERFPISFPRDLAGDVPSQT